jgi:hypothetical protein
MAKNFSSASSILNTLKPIDFSSDNDDDGGDDYYDDDAEQYLAPADADPVTHVDVDSLVKLSQQSKERAKQSRADKKAAAARLRREQAAAASSTTPHKWSELASTNGAAFYEREHPMELMRLNIFPIVPKGEKAPVARVVIVPKSIESIVQLLDAVHNIYPTQLASGAIAGELQYNGRALNDVRLLFHEQDLQLMYTTPTSGATENDDDDDDDDNNNVDGGVKNRRKTNNDDDDDDDEPDLPKKPLSKSGVAAAASSASSTPSKPTPSDLDKSMDAELDLLLGVSGARVARHIGKSRGITMLN